MFIYLIVVIVNYTLHLNITFALYQNKKYFRRGDLAAKQAEDYRKKQEVKAYTTQFFHKF